MQIGAFTPPPPPSTANFDQFLTRPTAVRSRRGDAASRAAEFAVAGRRSSHRTSFKVMTVVAVVATLLVVGAVYALKSSGAPTSRDPTMAGPGSQSAPPTSMAPSSSAATGPSAGADAKVIGMQGSDLVQGWTLVPGTGSAQSAPSSPGRCNPVSSAPWLADVTSPEYQSPGLWTAFSQVVVMADAAKAQAVLNALKAPGYETGCLQPSWDQWVVQSLANVNGQTSCALKFSGSSITASLPPVVTKTVPGAVGYQYQAQITCPTEGPSTLTRDVISAVVGNVFVQEQFFGGGDPPSTVVPGPITQMVHRASQVVAGKPV
ncbi:MAG TPA: hypothetical protein VN816_09135 [Acidimicrobiales bacterium]|nr:hypothetical protein [Acidimicrobiales bacterium]